MAKLASKTYGDALFELAVEENRVDSLYEELNDLEKILEDNADFSKLMNHPKITREEKEELIRDTFKGRVSDELSGFLELIVKNGRYGELGGVIDHFRAAVKEYKKIGVAHVATPMPLSDRQKEEIEKKLLETTDYQTMEMDYDIDPSLIGGMTIRIKDRVIDSSIRTRLDELRKDLSKIQLASH